MKRVADLITELQKFPPDALAYAYEGEVRGIIVVAKDIEISKGGGRGRRELGYVPADEGDQDDGPAEIYELPWDSFRA